MMPRPDLAELGVAYRRIPVLSIGRDVYLDMRLIIRKLEEMFPDGKLGASEPEEMFVEKLIEKWTVESPVFWAATGLVPAEAVKDPKFAEDRYVSCLG
jgi:glutathione S-transferase